MMTWLDLSSVNFINFTVERGSCNGEAFTAANIGHQLAMRDLMADLRAANPLAAGGGAKPFSRADRSRFLDALERMVRAAGRD